MILLIEHQCCIPAHLAGGPYHGLRHVIVECVHTLMVAELAKNFRVGGTRQRENYLCVVPLPIWAGGLTIGRCTLLWIIDTSHGKGAGPN